MKRLSQSILMIASMTAFLSLPAFAADTNEATTAPLTDPQIAMIAVTANQIDVDLGKLAKTKATNSRVKDFAERMIVDHTGVIKEANALTKKLGVKLETSAVSTSLLKEKKDTETKLKDLKGRAFDKAYIDHEVAYHEEVGTAIKDTLVPATKNLELKALLEKVEPVIAAHLEEAKQIQASFAVTH
jgi:putative membrane protein